MKTTEAVKALTSIANALRNSPFDSVEDIGFAPLRTASTNMVDVPRALSMLVALSSFSKAQWLEVIDQYEFPIDIRPRDASRDIMGKLLNYLEANPPARDRLSKATPKSRSHTSPELTQALELLLRT